MFEEKRKDTMISKRSSAVLLSLLVLLLLCVGVTAVSRYHSVDAWRWYAYYGGGSYSGFVPKNNMDGSSNDSPPVPAGVDYIDADVYRDVIESYDGRKTYWVVRTYDKRRIYRAGVKVPVDGKEMIFDYDYPVILSERKVFLGDAQKIWPEAVRHAGAIRRLFEYEDWGTNPELEKEIQREAGLAVN